VNKVEKECEVSEKEFERKVAVNNTVQHTAHPMPSHPILSHHRKAQHSTALTLVSGVQVGLGIKLHSVQMSLSCSLYHSSIQLIQTHTLSKIFSNKLSVMTV
jgi:hypothetical protein